MRFSVDETKCAGHGQCYTFYGKLFSDDDRGFNADRWDDWVDVPAGLEADAQRGVQICPEGAISIEVG